MWSSEVLGESFNDNPITSAALVVADPQYFSYHCDGDSDPVEPLPISKSKYRFAGVLLGEVQDTCISPLESLYSYDLVSSFAGPVQSVRTCRACRHMVAWTNRPGRQPAFHLNPFYNI